MTHGWGQHSVMEDTRIDFINLWRVLTLRSNNRANKVYRANMGPTWGRQDPGGPHVGPMNLAIWVTYFSVKRHGCQLKQTNKGIASNLSSPSGRHQLIYVTSYTIRWKESSKSHEFSSSTQCINFHETIFLHGLYIKTNCVLVIFWCRLQWSNAPKRRDSNMNKNKQHTKPLYQPKESWGLVYVISLIDLFLNSYLKYNELLSRNGLLIRHSFNHILINIYSPASND